MSGGHPDGDGGLGRVRGGELIANAGAVGDEAVADVGEERAHLGLVHAEEMGARGENAGPGAFGAALPRLDVHDGVRNRWGRGELVGGLDGQGAKQEQAGVLGGGDAVSARDAHPSVAVECVEGVAVEHAFDMWRERAGPRGRNALGGERRGEVGGAQGGDPGDELKARCVRGHPPGAAHGVGRAGDGGAGENGLAAGGVLADEREAAGVVLVAVSVIVLLPRYRHRPLSR